MENQLKKKLYEENVSFTNEETDWLMTHIGDKNAAIRDGLVFNLLGFGIASGGFTQEQFQLIKNRSISDDLLFFEINKQLPQTLTRSFTALLNGFLIEADGNSNSPYYLSLTANERAYLFDSAINYLIQETDKTGFSKDYGWVHAFAHGGDYLSKAVSHELFTKEQFILALNTLTHVINHLEVPFKDGEERRLAHVIYSGLLNPNLSQKLVVDWLKSFEFPLIKNEDFYRLATFEQMLAYIYFHSLDNIVLETELNELLLTYLKEF